MIFALSSCPPFLPHRIFKVIDGARGAKETKAYLSNKTATTHFGKERLCNTAKLIESRVDSSIEIESLYLAQKTHQEETELLLQGFETRLEADACRYETLEAKHQFEQYAVSHGVTITHYHADNGRFAEKTWIHTYLEERPEIGFMLW